MRLQGFHVKDWPLRSWFHCWWTKQSSTKKGIMGATVLARISNVTVWAWASLRTISVGKQYNLQYIRCHYVKLETSSLSGMKDCASYTTSLYILHVWGNSVRTQIGEWNWTTQRWYRCYQFPWCFQDVWMYMSPPVFNVLIRTDAA